MPPALNFLDQIKLIPFQFPLKTETEVFKKNRKKIDSEMF